VTNQRKKPIYSRFWVWALALVVVGGIAFGSGSDTPAEDAGEAVMVGDIEWRVTNTSQEEVSSLGDLKLVAERRRRRDQLPGDRPCHVRA
jgi:hypothetical protein